MATKTEQMDKRTNKRRSEDEMIADLQAKIEAVETRMKERETKASPLNKDFERFKKHAAKFVQACMDHERADIANSLLGVMNVVERQVQDA